MEILVGLIVLFLLAVPVLAISAYLRVLRLERRSRSAPDAQASERLQALERRVKVVEHRLAVSETVPPAALPPPPPQPVAPTPPPPPRLPTPPSPPRPALTSKAQPGTTSVDLETLIAGRWLNRIGIVALLFATTFFLKYAFDNNWVGPTGRVALGLLGGTLLLVFSQWLRGRGYRYFSDGMAGLGAGVLYLSLYAGWSFYRLFPQAVAFTGMIAVTAALGALAVGRNSRSVALLALLGGFLTPLLVSTGRDQQVVLFTYLAVLDAGLLALALARARNWRSLEFLSFAATQFYFWGWYASFYEASKLGRTAAFATLFFLLFAALPLLRSRRLQQFSPDQALLALLNAFWFLLALRVLLWPDHRWALTVAVLVLAAAYLAAAQAVRAPGKGEISPARLLFAGLALTCATLAIPIRLEGKWITIAWAVEGAVLVWSGLRARVWFLRGAGLLLFSLVAFRLGAFPIPAERVLLNPRFATFATAVICFAAAFAFARRQQQDLGPNEGNLFAVLGIGVNVFSLWALSLEMWDYFGSRPLEAALDPHLARQLGLSLLWTLYATGLIVLGVRRRQAALRWQALALFGLVVPKVFLFDLQSLAGIYRILSFLALGALVLVVSFLYQRRLAAGGGEEKA